MGCKDSQDRCFTRTESSTIALKMVSGFVPVPQPHRFSGISSKSVIFQDIFLLLKKQYNIQIKEVGSLHILVEIRHHIRIYEHPNCLADALKLKNTLNRIEFSSEPSVSKLQSCRN